MVYKLPTFPQVLKQCPSLVTVFDTQLSYQLVAFYGKDERYKVSRVGISLFNKIKLILHYLSCRTGLYFDTSLFVAGGDRGGGGESRFHVDLQAARRKAQKRRLFSALKKQTSLFLKIFDSMWLLAWLSECAVRVLLKGR